MKKAGASYAPSLKVLHWVIAVLIMVMLTVGFFLDNLPQSMQGMAYTLHKSTGITVLFLMVLMILVRIKKGSPALPDSVPQWQQKAAKTVHSLLYLLAVLMPLSGWIMSTAANRSPVFFWLVMLPFPGITPNQALASVALQCHIVFAFSLLTLVLLHVAAALKHYFWDKDEVLQQMWPKS